MHTTNGRLKLLYSNVQSLLSKFDELLICIQDTQPDIIAFTETWLHDDINNSEIYIEGFQIIRNDRESTKRGGGVILYVRKDIPVLHLSTESTAATPESIWVSVKPPKSGKLFVGVIYRPPCQDSSIDNLIIAEISKYSNKRNFIILGDFNAPSIDWNLMNSNSPELSFDKKLLKVFLDNFLVQHVSFPTRFRDGQRSNCLDLIFTKADDNIDNLRSYAPFGHSDHNVIACEYILFDKFIRNEVQKRNVWKADIQGMRFHIKNQNTDSLIGDNVETSWNHFENLFSHLIENFCPLVTVRKRNKPHWLSRNVKIQIRKKNKAWKLARQTGLDIHNDRYKRLRNECKYLISRTKISYETQLLENSIDVPKKFYAYINSKMKVREGIPSLITDVGEESTNDNEKASVLSDYFQSVFTEEPVDNFSVDQTYHTVNRLETIDIETEDVRRELLRLDSAKSAGPDGIPAKLLKDLCVEIAPILTLIFKQSFESGVLASTWKSANISPIHKSGAKRNPSNYRPISLTCICCKIFERIVKRKMTNYLESNNLLNTAQHGFRSGRSCVTNLLYAHQYWTKCLDNKIAVDTIYFDFSKAFDSVPHKRLLYKIRNFGITGLLYNWIEQFLTGRLQRVRVNMSNSQWRPVISGVPQGSVLGPLLFLLYVDDIAPAVRSHILMFADDIKIWRPLVNSDDSIILQNDINTLQKWSETWLLKFNVSKCVVLHLQFRKSEPQYTYYLEDRILTNVVKEKDLGVIITDTLRPSTQCAKAANKAMSTMRRIKRAFNVITPSVFCRVYKAFVRPHLEYAIQVWRPWLKNDINMLSLVQRRCTKLVDGLYNSDFLTRESTLNLFPLPYRQVRGDLLLAFRIIRLDDCGLDFEDFFQYAATTHLRGHPWKLQKERPKHPLRQFCFSHRVVDLWNSLPAAVVSASTLTSFKNALDYHFFPNILPQISN
jgi:hypothetical protein